MRTIVKEKQRLRQKRAWRVRKHINGTANRPRLSVHKTNKHIHVQLIDDETGTTLGSASSFEKKYRDTEFGRKNKEAARKLGESIAQIAKEKNIKEVIFDRGPFKYHGILAELADAARKAGLQF
jgi:large subunit ribosomal protein L18